MADEGTAELGDLLMRVARTQRRRWRDVLAPWELSPHHARALKVVSERDGVRLAPRAAPAGADGLQERGLIQRTPDPGDRRAVILRLTDEGRRVRGEIGAARAADSEDLFARLSADDRSTLARLLRTLSD